MMQSTISGGFHTWDRSTLSVLLNRNTMVNLSQWPFAISLLVFGALNPLLEIWFTTCCLCLSYFLARVKVGFCAEAPTLRKSFKPLAFVQHYAFNSVDDGCWKHQVPASFSLYFLWLCYSKAVLTATVQFLLFFHAWIDRGKSICFLSFLTRACPCNEKLPSHQMIEDGAWMSTFSSTSAFIQRNRYTESGRVWSNACIFFFRRSSKYFFGKLRPCPLFFPFSPNGALQLQMLFISIKT